MKKEFFMRWEGLLVKPQEKEKALRKGKEERPPKKTLSYLKITGRVAR